LGEKSQGSPSFCPLKNPFGSGKIMKKKNTGTEDRSLKKDKRPKRHTMSALLNIMAKLRGTSGCPWDREQTEQTLKKFLIEEAYETLEAIEAGTPEALKEELGDLLLQIIFLSRIAEEKGEFDFSDVVHTLAEKLIHRHPHVFPSSSDLLKAMKPKNAQDVIKVWGIAKELEGKYAKRTSLLDGLPLALPALERSRRLAQRISRSGFDRPRIETLWKEVEKDFGELKKATRLSSPRVSEERLGDLLFALVNWARFKDITAEEALRKANRRFTKRFRRTETELRRKEKTLVGSNPEEMDGLWNKGEREKRG
jgi:tetrapyrrole methylase family protein / MazG family protein